MPYVQYGSTTNRLVTKTASQLHSKHHPPPTHPSPPRRLTVGVSHSLPSPDTATQSPPSMQPPRHPTLPVSKLPPLRNNTHGIHTAQHSTADTRCTVHPAGKYKAYLTQPRDAALRCNQDGAGIVLVSRRCDDGTVRGRCCLTVLYCSIRYRTVQDPAGAGAGGWVAGGEEE